MYRMWKRLFIVATILLVSCTAFGGFFWYQLNVTKIRLADTEAQLSVTENQLAATEAQLSVTEN